MSQEFNFKGLFRTAPETANLAHKSFFEFMEELGLDDPKLRVVAANSGKVYLHAIREEDGQYVSIRISEKCNFDADNDDLTDLVDNLIFYGTSTYKNEQGEDVTTQWATIAPQGTVPDPKMESSLEALKKAAAKSKKAGRSA